MTEIITETPKKPWIVVLLAVIDFIFAFFLALGIVGLIAIFVLGNEAMIAEKIQQQVRGTLPQANIAVSFVKAILTFAVAFCAALLTADLFAGIGLLKAKKWGWYLQITLCVIGLVSFFPFGLIVNPVFLFFLFQRPVRDYFKV